MRILGREPALIIGALCAIAQMLVCFWPHWSANQIASVNAIILAVAGIATAALLAQDHLVPAVVGLIQAAITLGLAFGIHWAPGQIAMIMAAVTAFAALFGVRPQVVALVTPTGEFLPRQSLYPRRAAA